MAMHVSFSTLHFKDASILMMHKASLWYLCLCTPSLKSKTKTTVGSLATVYVIICQECLLKQDSNFFLSNLLWFRHSHMARPCSKLHVDLVHSAQIIHFTCIFKSRVYAKNMSLAKYNGTMIKSCKVIEKFS